MIFGDNEVLLKQFCPLQMLARRFFLDEIMLNALFLEQKLNCLHTI